MSKQILILGGTQFIGRNLVEQLQSATDYEITLFNRQQTQAGLFPSLKKIKGDRETDAIRQIAGEQWDFVIDLSCYYPDSLAQVLTYLPDTLDKYIFISTCSVYDNEQNRFKVRDEQAEIMTCDEEQKIDRTPSSYGNRKAECERILGASRYNHSILRPALVYGAHDHTDRLYYWLYQVKTQNTILLPDQGLRKFSITYVHDLVQTIIQALTQPTPHPIYNVITVPEVSIGQIVSCAMDLLQKQVPTVNASPEFLKENHISQWTDMPLWIDGDHFTYSNQKLKQDFTWEESKFETSIQETIAYYDTLNWPVPKYGISEIKRQGLLEKLS